MQVNRNQQIHKYVQGVLTALEEKSPNLTSTERRFGSKYGEALRRVRQIEADLTQLREQMRQAEARIRSLELQHGSESGRADAFMESLIAAKFDPDPPPPTEDKAEGPAEAKAEAQKDEGGNGAEPPQKSPPAKKARAKSSKPKEKPQEGGVAPAA